jgi:hypothetical protein
MGEIKQVTSVKKSYIYSDRRLHPFSFLTGCLTRVLYKKENRLDTPSPDFIEVYKLQEKPKLDKKSILEGMVINDKLGLVLLDKNITVKFKGIIGNMISQIISSLFTGKPISLLVRLFEPKSTLQRIMDYWAFAPTILKEAVKVESPFERMKKVMSFAIAGLYVPAKQLKPFNPNIGETFQGEFENGCRVYAEHVSHYPTVAQFYLLDDEFKIHGYFDFLTNVESFGSKIKIEQKGPIRVDFPNIKERIIYNMPVIKLLNARGEENRGSIWLDYMIFVDVKNNLKGIVQLGNDSKCIHALDGYIIDYQYPMNYKFDIDAEKKLASKGCKSKPLARITGSWLKELLIDGKEYWNIDKQEPSWIKPCTNVLPSDGRYREDLIWLFRSFYDAKDEVERKLYEDYAQNWKIMIEQVQRAEREIKKKARAKATKK